MSYKLIIGYLTDWSFYKGYTSKTIDYSKYDIINYSFFSIKNNGELVAPSEPLESQGRMLFGEIDWRRSPENVKLLKDTDGEWTEAHFYPCEGVFQKALENDCKVLASIGGWAHSKEFEHVSKSKKSRTKFIEECVNLCKNYGFDGIDLDWEFPEEDDRESFTGLVRDLRKALDEEFGTDKDSAWRKMLTSCFAVYRNDVSTVYDIPKLNEYLDLFNLMTYDQCVGVNNYASHNSPLHAYPGDQKLDKNVHNNVQRFIKLGCPREKITIGIGFYGRSFIGCDYVGEHFVKTGEEFSYKTIKEFKDNGTSELYDMYAHTNYITVNGMFISYDGLASISMKAKYIVDKGLAGSIIWPMAGCSTDQENRDEIEETEDNYLLNSLRTGLDKRD
jgi:chitinase